LTTSKSRYNMRYNMEIKVRKIGNSYGVILPGEVLDQLQVKEGGMVQLLPNAEGTGFQLTAESTEFETQMRAARDLMQRYRETLRELSK